jgi:hypothetical protein
MRRIPLMIGACVVMTSGGCPTPGLLTPVGRAGRVVLLCEPADAEVTVDGVPVGICSDYASSDHGLPVGGGVHRLRFRKKGHISLELEVAPDAAQAVVHARLEPVRKEEQGP